MRDHTTNSTTKTTGPTDHRQEASPALRRDFDPRAVFADPVGYLERLGIEAELMGPEADGLATAA